MSDRPLIVELSTEEAWLLYDVFCEWVDSEATPDSATDPAAATPFDIVEKLESECYMFTATEREILQSELTTVATSDERPKRDRAVARAVLRRLPESPPTDDA